MIESVPFGFSLSLPHTVHVYSWTFSSRLKIDFFHNRISGTNLDENIQNSPQYLKDVAQVGLK